MKINKYKITSEITNYKITKYRLQTTNYKLPISIHKLQNYNTQNTKLQITEHKLQNATITT